MRSLAVCLITMLVVVGGPVHATEPTGPETATKSRPQKTLRATPPTLLQLRKRMGEFWIPFQRDMEIRFFFQTDIRDVKVAGEHSRYKIERVWDQIRVLLNDGQDPGPVHVQVETGTAHVSLRIYEAGDGMMVPSLYKVVSSETERCR